MIIGTFNKYEVGKIYVVKEITDERNQKYYNVPVYILEESTREAYKEYQKEFGNELPSTFDILTYNANFYRISID